MRIGFRKAPRMTPRDLVARRVLARADRLRRELIAVPVSAYLLGDPPFERSALAARQAELARIPPWAPSGRIAAARHVEIEGVDE